jgi:hypothetical protein
MSSVLDYLLVGLVLLVSAGYAVLALGPRTLRPRVYASLSRLLARVPVWLGLGAIARRLEAASGKAGGACGGCGTCGSEPAGSAGSVGDGPAPPAAEVRISASKIGRRV